MSALRYVEEDDDRKGIDMENYIILGMLFTGLGAAIWYFWLRIKGE